MSDDELRQPGGRPLHDDVQMVDNADADVTCPRCHHRMVKVDGKARGCPAVFKQAEYLRGMTGLASCQACDITQLWSFVRSADEVLDGA